VLSTSVDTRFAALGVGDQPVGGAVFGTGASAGAGGTAVGFDAFAAGANDTAVGANAHVGADNSTALGANTTIAAGATFATAVGAGATVTAAGDHGVALGAGATVNAANAVAIGAGSVANDPNTVSFGSPGNERRLENVAAGVSPTDAANVGQLQGLAVGVNDSLHTISQRSDAGVAGAVAAVNIPQAFLAGHSTFGVGVGVRGDQAAVAIGGSTLLNDGRTTFKASVSIDTQDKPTAGAGVGWQF
jgi:autotransporter adhesin